MPKLNKYGETDTSTHNDKAKAKIHDTFNAIKKYGIICCIATGILQILMLIHGGIVGPQTLKYHRTLSSNIPIEDVIADYLHINLFRFMVFTLI